MELRHKSVFGGLLIAFLVAVLPGRAQTNCASNQTAAVQCFVANAVKTQLATVPAGMTLADYQAYGVAVSRILQTNHTYLVVVGTTIAISDAMPPTNADGTSNQAAQDIAVNSIIEAALNDFLIGLPRQTNAKQMQLFAREMVAHMDKYNGVSFSPGAVLQMLDSYVVTATSNGLVDWNKATNSIGGACDALIQSGLISLPSGVQALQLKQFAFDVAQAIHTYKTATGRKIL